MRIIDLNKGVCAALASVALVGCSTAHHAGKETGSGTNLPTADWMAKSLPLHKIWGKSLSGYIAELTIASRGGAVLVATLPDFDHAGGADRNYLRYFDGKGRERWKITLSTQVKSQALSKDGSLAIATTHEDEIIAFNSKGRELWKAKGTCAPMIIESRKEIVCYHDDDAEPEVAFDVLDWNGKTKLSVPIANDILALKISGNEQHVAYGLTRGSVQVVGSVYQPEWTAAVSGEIIDLDVSNEGKVAVLYSKGKTVHVAIIANGKIISDAEPSDRATEIAWSSPANPDHLFLYGNAVDGQYFSGMSAAPLEERWHHAVANNAHYTPTMFAVSSPTSLPTSSTKSSVAVIGLEEVTPSARVSRILGVHVGGDVLWNISVSDELKSDEGAFLYAQSLAREASRLAVATDDRHFGVFDLQATLRP